MIRLYPISDLKYTIFEDEKCKPYFYQRGIEVSADIAKADLFISRNLKGPVLAFLNSLAAKGIPPKPTLVWTHEPRFSNVTANTIGFDGFPSIHIMNLYTGGVYFSNLTFYGKFITRLLPPVEKVRFSQKPVAALATYSHAGAQPFLIDGKDIDLVGKRQQLIIDTYSGGLADIYGRHWPASMSKSESRGEGWHKKKLEILGGYQFNIALENTSYANYCTEKIWDSISAGCLPLYSSFNNSINDLFPPGSFIDYDEFPDNRELISFIKSMSKVEYLERLNKCIEVYNSLYSSMDFWSEKSKALKSAADKIHEICSNQ